MESSSVSAGTAVLAPPSAEVEQSSVFLSPPPGGTRPSVVQTLPVRPIPVPIEQTFDVRVPLPFKVVRPVPQRVAEQFYKETEHLGIPYPQVHEAVMESHEWHRRWTQQEETGHTVPEPDSSDTGSSDVVAFISARECGAKNPSPDNDSFSLNLRDRKRTRILDDEEEEEECVVSPLSPGSEENEGVHGDNKRRLARRPSSLASPSFVRPLALRIIPKALRSSEQLDFDRMIPREIVNSHAPSSLDYTPPLSPLTLSTVSINGSRRPCRQSTTEEGPAVIEEEELYRIPSIIMHPTKAPPRALLVAVEKARDGLLHSMAVTGGDTSSDSFQAALEVLVQHFRTLGIDACANQSRDSEGVWLTLTKPTYFGNLGENDAGDPLYTLGRMSFDMFSPTNIVCSLQGNFNSVERVTDTDARQALLDKVPTGLRDDVARSSSVLRTYDVLSPFTIESILAAYPKAPNKDVRRPIRGIMTTYGYTLPDPRVPNRHSVWITGGRIEPSGDETDSEDWIQLFTNHPPKHGLGEQAKLLAVKLLMGALVPTEISATGSMEYTFTRPLGGHGIAYVDTLFVDDTLRIVRGHRGTIFVFTRMPEQR